MVVTAEYCNLRRQAKINYNNYWMSYVVVVVVVVFVVVE